MNKKVKIAIVSGVVVLFIVLIYFFGGNRGESEYVSDDWYESYSPSDKGPYGTYMLKELLDTVGMFGDFIELDESLEDALEDDPNKNDIYFFIGPVNYLDEASGMTLLDFVFEGNTVFMSSKNFPQNIMDVLSYDSYYLFEDSETIDSTQFFKFTHQDLTNRRYKSDYVYNNELTVETWKYFENGAFIHNEDLKPSILGTNTKDKQNFIRINYGEGQFFLHSTPYLMTNVNMMKRDGFQYVEDMLAHIPPGRIQWDRYNLSPNSKDSGSGEPRRSMLEFLLQYPTLIWAMCILIFGAILYAIFKGKRMQRVIPATELKENTSMSYINTLSSLYQQENKHNKLIHLKEKTFLNFIAEKYYITCKEPDLKFFEKVALKSQVNRDEIADIFKRFEGLKKVSVVSDESLIMLHKKIEMFYKKCR